MARGKRLSDATVQTALKAIGTAIELTMIPTKNEEELTVSEIQQSIEKAQALFDARRELTALATPTTPRAAGRPKGSKNKSPNPRDVAILGGDPSL